MKNLFKKIALLSLAMLVFGCSKDDTPAEVVKTKVKITGFKVDNIPFTAPDGLGWDGLTGLPDVYCDVFRGTTTYVLSSNTATNLTQSSLPLTVTFNAPYSVPLFSDTINIVVMDNDLNDSPSNADDLIGYVPFIMNDYTTGADKYPTTKTKTANGVTVTLFLTWE